MVRLRTLDYPEITTCDEDHTFAVDLDTVDTQDITFENLTNIVTSDIFKSKQYNLVKVDENTWHINSRLYSEKGIKKELYDGLVLEIKPTTVALFPYNYQSVPGAKLLFNEITSKPIYNGFFYDTYGVKGLDKNTLWNRIMYFKYNKTEDCWLLYKTPYSTAWEISDNHVAMAGTISCITGYPFVINTTDYPLLSTIFPSLTLPHLVDTCFVGVGDNTPARALSQGCLKDFDFSFDFSDLGEIKINTVIETSSPMTGTGIVSYGTSGTNYFEGTANLSCKKTTYKIVPNITLNDKIDNSIVNTSNEHLTKRIGRCIRVII